MVWVGIVEQVTVFDEEQGFNDDIWDFVEGCEAVFREFGLVDGLVVAVQDVESGVIFLGVGCVDATAEDCFECGRVLSLGGDVIVAG